MADERRHPFIQRFMESPQAIRMQAMFYILFAHANQPFKSYYRNRQERWTISRPGTHGHLSNPFEEAPDAVEWCWRGLPDKWLIKKLYDVVSNSWMIYVCVRELLVRQLTIFTETSWPHTNWLQMPIHCILVGRFMFHSTVEHLGSPFFSFLHLGWRIVQSFTGREHSFSYFTFLLQSERDLDKFQRLMKFNEHSIYLNDGPVSLEVGPNAPAVLSGGWAPLCSTANSEGPAAGKGQLVGGLLAGSAISPLEGSGKMSRSASANASTVGGVHERFLRHLLCYEVHHKGRLLYRLRPNRTHEARRKLTRHLANTSLMSLCSFMALALPISLAVFVTILSDRRYVHVYPGCSKQVDLLSAQGQLESWTFTPTLHRFIAFPFDGIENLIIWVDSGLAVTFVAVLGFLLNGDILLYWGHLHGRLEWVLSRAQSSQAGHQKEAKRTRIDVQSFEGQLSAGERTQLGAEIHELQFEVADFFSQIRLADTILSDVMSANILMWLLGCAFLSYLYLSRPDMDMPLVINMIQIVGFAVFTVATSNLLNLQRCCRRSHRLMRTLLSYDLTPDAKLTLMRILEFFTDRRRTNYTLFHRYPYEATTYMSIIGWSFSCFFVVYSLFGQNRTSRRNTSAGQQSEADF